MMATCKNEGCDRGVYARGLCRPCYMRSYRGLDYVKVYYNRGRICTVPVCGKRQHAKGLCASHYRAQLPASKLENARTKRVCSVEGCGRAIGSANRTGMCEPCRTKKYQREYYLKKTRAKRKAAKERGEPGTVQ